MAPVSRGAVCPAVMWPVALETETTETGALGPAVLWAPVAGIVVPLFVATVGVV